MPGSRRTYSDDDVLQWAAMYERQRMTLAQISEKTGASQSVIASRMRKLGFSIRKFTEDSKSPLELFEQKFTPEPNTGCWLWLGGTQAAGYGFFKHAGDTTAHRSSWILYRGPIPEGLHVLHKCDVRQCVNPDHLFLGTQVDNMKDMAAKGRAQRYNSARTHCRRGHPYDEANTMFIGDRQHRHCRECGRIRARALRMANLARYRERDRQSYWKKKAEQERNP